MKMKNKKKQLRQVKNTISSSPKCSEEDIARKKSKQPQKYVISKLVHFT